MALTDEQEKKVEELAESLVGTCRFAHREIQALTMQEAEFLDTLARECNDCGWWHEPSELNGNDECEDCAEESADEDEE